MEIDSQISAIQKSTRTTFKFMLPVHDWLRNRSKTYYGWHTNPHANTVHWTTAGASLALSAAIILTTMFPSVQATGSTWTQTAKADFDAGTKTNVVVAGTGDAANVTIASYTFDYRKAVAIDNTSGGALTNYQINVVLTSSNFDFSKTQSNGNDIRFYDSNSTTALSYWTESWDANAQTASIWVKVPSVSAATTKTIYLYYGNANAPSVSNGSQTFIDFSDFQDLNGWTIANTGNGSVTNSNGVATVAANSGSASMWRAVSPGVTSYVIESKYQRPSTVRNRLSLLNSDGSASALGFEIGDFDQGIYWNGWTGTSLVSNTWYTMQWIVTPSDVYWNFLNYATGAVVSSQHKGSAASDIARAWYQAGGESSSDIELVSGYRVRVYTANSPTVSVVADSGSKTITSSSGIFTSSTFDAQELANPSTINWDATTPGNSSVAFQIRSADTEAGLSSATWYGPTSTSDYYTTSGTAINAVHNGNRWLQYKAVLATDDSANLPALNSVSIGYSAADKTFSSNASIGGDGITYTVNDLTVDNGATLTIAGGTTLNVLGTLNVTDGSTIIAQGTNRAAQINSAWAGVGVTINAHNVLVSSDSKISADGQGYVLNAGPGHGQINGCSGNSSYGSGGSYGGSGGPSNGYGSPATYGSVTHPTDLGSGGGGNAAGNGGGAISLSVSGTLTLNGTISANGTDGVGNGCNANGGGSGGSIYSSIGTLAGSGHFAANAGSATGPYSYGAGGGGGGRLFINAQINDGFSSSNITATGGGGGYVGTNGTIFFISNGSLAISQSMNLPDLDYSLYPNITVENGATLTIPTGTSLNLQGTLTITGDSSVLFQGANVAVEAQNITIDAGSHISADAQGYGDSSGPGAGTQDYRAGSYGGNGGDSSSNLTYGNPFQPTDLGSGGHCLYNCSGGVGGGAIKLVARGTLTNNGSITANGTAGGGGGAGGSIWINAGTLFGSGTIAANGGGGTRGGGGGRVAVYYGNADTTFQTATNITAAATLKNGDPVATNGTVILAPAGNLTISQSMTISANTPLSFSGITINNGATLTLGGNSPITLTDTLTVTGNSVLIFQPSGDSGATITTANVQVDAGSHISADGQGYADSSGPGAGTQDYRGGSYGGVGGDSSSGITYGNPFQPVSLGSGGHCLYNCAGGAGGGAIKMVISNALTNNGSITANGADGGGGGAGGSIWINTHKLTGSGSIAANGGGGTRGGGGGRVAVYYGNADTTFQTATNITANATLENGSPAATNGTVITVPAGNLTVSQTMLVPSNTPLTFARITINNGANFTLDDNSPLTVTDKLTLSDNSTLTLKPTGTAGATITAANVQVDAGSHISADGQGYAGGWGSSGTGPGASRTGGGSYGGVGTGDGNPGSTYGDRFQPIELGSGGGCLYNCLGGTGGGAIRMVVSDTLTNNGSITADGTNVSGGAGSGGSIWINTQTLAGSGSISANGGGGSASGGGGRVAVYYLANTNFLRDHATSSAGGSEATDGTVIFSALPVASLSTVDGQLVGPTPALSLVSNDADHRSLGAKLEYVQRQGSDCSSQNWDSATVFESTTPDGWSGNGRYSDGNTATYTVSNITSGTYCWRATVKPLEGLFTEYSDWSTARSFTVDASAPDNFVVNTDVNNDVFTHSSDIPTSINGTIADDANGQGIPANAVTLTLERSTDSQYWNGAAWVGHSATFPATNTATTGNSSATWLASSLPTWTEGKYTIAAQAVDKVGNKTAPKTSSFTYDKTPPVTVSTVYDGSVTGKETQYATTAGTLSANWPATTDAVSEIGKYEYAIGTAMGGSNVLPWTDNGTSLSFTKTGLTLTSGATYYVSVIAEDAVGNVSAIQVSSGVIVDTQAPAAVTDLTAQPASSTSATIYWTTPGDDGSTGTATSYDLRMSTSPITNDNFAQATAVTNTPTPTAAGNTQQVTISSLTAGTTYYFALKATDKAAHVSELSNVASVITQSDSIAETVPTKTVPAVTLKTVSTVSNTSNVVTPITLNMAPSESIDTSKLTITANAPTVVLTVRSVDQTLSDGTKTANVLEQDPASIVITPKNPDKVSGVALTIASKAIVLAQTSDTAYAASVVPPGVKGAYLTSIDVTYKDGTVETRQLAMLIDPTGYVYEKTSAGQIRLDQVTVTLKEKTANGLVNWDAAKFGQTNPQITAADGQYTFFVPAGTYQLTATKDGYHAYISGDINVINEPVSLNIELSKDQLQAISNSISQAFSGVIGGSKNIIVNIHKLSAPIASNKSVAVTQNTTTVVAAAVVTVTAVLPTVANLPMLDFFGHIFAYLAALVTRRKKQKALGQVIDSESGQPVAGAVVRITTSDTGKVLETQVTDAFGNFAFLVAPGTYTVETTKDHYQFPSHMARVGYHGETISFKKETPLQLTVPGDPELKTISKRLMVLSTINQIALVLRLPILILGTVLTLIFAFGQPSVLNMLIAVFYILAWIHELMQRFLMGRFTGQIVDQETNAALDLAIVRLARPDGKLIASKVSNQKGHFLVQAAPGQYNVTVTRRGYQQLLNVSWQTKKHDTLAKEFKLEPQKKEVK